ncbi:MAG: hypothetical protein KF900_12360 [Bacteroidetes bacterium]|nr:hypothetical protein [Bacteroidota bacterium]
MGEDFWVLAGDFDTTSPWDDDIKSYQQKITRIPVSVYYPYYKRVLPKNLFQKLLWKISLWYNQYLEKNYNGNFWDDSRLYVDTFLKQAEKIIQEKSIQHICLTVGPFEYATILPELKAKFPYLKITIDFRDYWEDSFDKLNNEKIQIEKLNKVLQSVDLVLVPNEEMCEHYKTMYKKNTYCLPHCIDEDYMVATSISEPIVKNEKKFTLMYGGNLYSNMENYVLLLIQLIKFVEQKGYEVKFKIYTMQPAYMNLFEEHKVNVELNKQIPTEQFIKTALDSDLLVLLRPDWSPNGFSSKFFEYIALRKTLLYVGPKGKVNDFISNHSIGFVLNSENTEQISLSLIENRHLKKIPNRSFNLNEHTFEYQTEKLINYLNRYYN